MAETFKLPASSYEEIVKIIKAYSAEKEGMNLSLENISQATGVPRTVVSGNNGFLVQMGIITEGNKKAATDIGRMLGRAYTSKIQYEIVRLWKEIIAESDFLNRMISAVRIRNGMDRASFLNHVVYSSGLKDTKQNRTGAGALIEVLKDVVILTETDGKLTVVEEPFSISDEAESLPTKENNSIEKVKNVYTATPSVCGKNTVVINININCSVDEIDTLSAKMKELLKSIT